MPSRVIREGIITSDRVNRLTPQAEVFYRRLMSFVDDFGRYDGRTSILRAMLYPLQLDRVSEKDVSTWLEECQSCDLVKCYKSGDGTYLEVARFGQLLRAKRSKWPAFDETCAQMPSTCAQIRSESESNPKSRIEYGVGIEIESESEGGSMAAPVRSSDSDSIQAKRRVGWLKFNQAIEPLLKSSGKQLSADRTCARNWWEDVIWPEGLDPPMGERRLEAFKSLVAKASSNGHNRMAYLTKMIRQCKI